MKQLAWLIYWEASMRSVTPTTADIDRGRWLDYILMVEDHGLAAVTVPEAGRWISKEES